MKTRSGILAVFTGAAVLANLAGRVEAQAPPAVSAQAQPANARAVAAVDGEVITLADVEAILQARPMPVQVTEAQRREMQQAALAMMIDDILLQRFLRQKGPRLDPAEVAQRMAQLVEGLKRQGKTLQDFCRETGQTEAELRDAQTLMLQWVAFARARVTDAEVQRYFAENKDFFDGVAVRAAHIVIRMPPGTSDGERQAARARLLALRQEIVAGKLDFAAAAAKHSQCTSAQQGGDVGFFPRKGVVDEAFARTAFALPVGHVSDVVQTDYGLHLIKVTERKPGQPADFQRVKEDVRGMCVEELRQTLLAELRKSAKVQISLP